MKQLMLLGLFATALGACSNGEVSNPPESPDTNAGSDAPATAKVQSPIRISYRVIGQPVVGQPTAIDLQFSSALGTQPFDIAYRINDSTALRLPETQLARVAVSPSLEPDARGFAAQQVTVVPLREGRLFLNVAAEIETETGSFSSVTAVPIQVGKAPGEPQENGTVVTDESGELVRSLPGKTE